MDHPHLGSLIATELGSDARGLPGCITVGKDATVGSGYLPPEAAPLIVEKIEKRDGRTVATLSSRITGELQVPEEERDPTAEEAWTRCKGTI